MKFQSMIALLCAPLLMAGCAVWVDEFGRGNDGGPAPGDDDVADDDVADDDVADDDAADDDVADDDDADDDVADDDASDDDAGDDDAGDDDTAGSNVANVPADFPTIQDAIDHTSDGDVIEVEPGTYYENLDFGGRAVHILGLGGWAATILDGGQQGAVVTLINGEGADSILEGFTLTHGSGEVVLDGDGIAHDCGGGLFIDGASPTLVSVVVTGNTGWDGGGIYLTGGAAPTLTNVAIEGNQAADDGGGLYANTSSPVLTNVIVNNNVANGQDGGGVIVKESSIATLNNVIFRGNIAPDDGGGMRVKASTATLVNVTFVGNQAYKGGGLSTKESTTTMTNVIVAMNLATGEGGGVYEHSDGSASYDSCNFYGNTPTDHDGSCGVPDPIGSDGNVSTNPFFVDISDPDPGNWDLHVGFQSPMIDSGNAGVVDPDGSPSDRGAYGGPGAAGWDRDQDGYFEWWLPGVFDPATSPGMDCDDRDSAVFPGSGC